MGPLGRREYCHTILGVEAGIGLNCSSLLPYYVSGSVLVPSHFRFILGLARVVVSSRSENPDFFPWAGCPSSSLFLKILADHSPTLGPSLPWCGCLWTLWSLKAAMLGPSSPHSVGFLVGLSLLLLLVLVSSGDSGLDRWDCHLSHLLLVGVVAWSGSCL